MRVFVGGLFHETNAFSPVPTGLEDYEITDGAEPLDALGRRIFGYGDLAQAAADAGCDVRTGFFASAQPSAPTDRASYEELRRRLIASLREAGPVDGILLFCHGAQIAEGYDDCESDIVEHLRQIVGTRVPIGVELDLHANVGRRLIDAASVVLTCWEYPHIDFLTRARKLVAACQAIAGGTPPPRAQFQTLPVFANLPTRSGPGATLIAAMTRAEETPGVLVSVAHGFALCDTPATHASIWVYCAQNQTSVLKTLIDTYVEAAVRRDVEVPLHSLDPALDNALARAEGPVVLADRADNPGAGAPGDSTFVLRALLARGVSNVAVGMIWDPGAVEAAHRLGAGHRGRISIGGRFGEVSGAPVDQEVEVLETRSNVTQRAFGVGQPMPIGRSAALRIGGVLVVVNALRQQTMSREVFTAHGIDPHRLRLIVVKSTNHFEEDFRKFAREILYCDAPGASSEDLRTYRFKRLPRPSWPLDRIEDVIPDRRSTT